MPLPAGDAHRLYLRLRRRYPGGAPAELPELAHLREMRQFYETLAPADLRLLQAWLRKERKGIGMIPIALPAIIWFAFLFGGTIEQTVSGRWTYGWAALLLLWVPLAVGAVYWHFRDQAWTELHVALVEDALQQVDGEGKPSGRRPGLP